MKLSKLSTELYFMNNFKLAKSTLIGTMTLENSFPRATNGHLNVQFKLYLKKNAFPKFLTEYIILTLINKDNLSLQYKYCLSEF